MDALSTMRSFGFTSLVALGACEATTPPPISAPATMSSQQVDQPVPDAGLRLAQSLYEQGPAVCNQIPINRIPRPNLALLARDHCVVAYIDGVRRQRNLGEFEQYLGITLMPDGTYVGTLTLVIAAANRSFRITCGGETNTFEERRDYPASAGNCALRVRRLIVR